MWGYMNKHPKTSKSHATEQSAVRKSNLDDLIARITSENQHPVYFDDPPVGREFPNCESWPDKKKK